MEGRGVAEVTATAVAEVGGEEWRGAVVKLIAALALPMCF